MSERPQAASAPSAFTPAELARQAGDPAAVHAGFRTDLCRDTGAFTTTAITHQKPLASLPSPLQTFQEGEIV